MLASAEEAYIAHSTGQVETPLRTEFALPDVNGVALVMPGLIPQRLLGVKMVGSAADADPAAPRHTACVMTAWDTRTLDCRGFILSEAFNDYRTAAGLAAATKALARPDSRTHVLYGAGKLSYAVVRCISHVRPIDRLIIVSRTAASREKLAERVRSTRELTHLHVETDVPADEAAAFADIATTVTRAVDPVFDGRRLRDGAHVNLGGAMRRNEREMDDAAASRASMYVDCEERLPVARRRRGAGRSTAAPSPKTVLGAKSVRCWPGAYRAAPMLARSQPSSHWASLLRTSTSQLFCSTVPKPRAAAGYSRRRRMFFYDLCCRGIAQLLGPVLAGENGFVPRRLARAKAGRHALDQRRRSWR